MPLIQFPIAMNSLLHRRSKRQSQTRQVCVWPEHTWIDLSFSFPDGVSSSSAQGAVDGEEAPFLATATTTTAAVPPLSSRSETEKKSGILSTHPRAKSTTWYVQFGIWRGFVVQNR